MRRKSNLFISIQFNSFQWRKNKHTPNSIRKWNKRNDERMSKNTAKQMSNCHWRSASQRRQVANALFFSLIATWLVALSLSLSLPLTLFMSIQHMLWYISNGNLTCIYYFILCWWWALLGPGWAHDHHITTAFIAL